MTFGEALSEEDFTEPFPQFRRKIEKEFDEITEQFRRLSIDDAEEFFSEEETKHTFSNTTNFVIEGKDMNKNENTVNLSKDFVVKILCTFLLESINVLL